MNDFKAIREALYRIPTYQRKAILPHLERIEAAFKRRGVILHLIQGALTQLRSSIKLLILDRDAARRERDEYRLQLGLDRLRETKSTS